MRKYLSCFILCGLVFLVACSGDDPSSSGGATRTTSDVWQITSLEASDTNPYINVPVVVTATVSYNGEPAPAGTSVEFLASGGSFSNGSTEASVLTQDGEAGIVFGASETGTYTIQARVHTVRSTITITYRDRDTSGGLQIYNINPTSGSYAGGETAVLTGKGIRTPAEVYFTVQGVEYQAIVDDVVPSVPATGAGTITIRTPEPTAADTTVTSGANVRVVVGVGTTEQEEKTYPSAFTYIGVTEPDPDVPPTPVVFGVSPYYGSSQGGETVTILGMNFAWEPPVKELEQTYRNVYFRFRGEDILVQVERWSENQIEVITPRFSLTPLIADENAGVVLVPTNGEPDVVKDNVFIVMADVAQPAITGFQPPAGPIDGGTVVTIMGSGFEVPLQVMFGSLEASDVQVYDDQSINDNDQITCVTPDYSQQNVTPPFAAAVKVTNLATGNTATAAQTFIFGDSLYITQANPTEGQIGEVFVLYGAGFEDPLTVWFQASGGAIEFDVLSVTGTELTLRPPADLAPTCTDRSGTFRVVLTESGREATGGNYTLLGSTPTITDVDPIFVDELNNGNTVDPDEIDIYGVRFADELLVLINDYTIAPDRVTVDSPEHIMVDGIPAPNDFNLVFETAACTTGSGLTGVKQVPTAVDVTVRNLPLGCQDTLADTLVYVPQDQSCQVAPQLQAVVPAFPDAAAGTCTPPQPLILNNLGAGTLEIQTLFLQGRFFFQAGYDQEEGPLTIPPYGSNSSLNLYFCPDVDNNGVYSGQLVITSNDPGSPASFPLTGNELAEAAITTSIPNGGTWDFPDTVQGNCSATATMTISSTGDADLLLQSVSSTSTEFVIQNPPAGNTVLVPGAVFDLEMQFCPDNSGAGPRTGALLIDHNGTNQVDPITINLTGDAT